MGTSVSPWLWETSLLDSEEGIRFRGYSIPELQKVLPAAHPSRAVQADPRLTPG